MKKVCGQALYMVESDYGNPMGSDRRFPISAGAVCADNYAVRRRRGGVAKERS